MKRTSPGLAIVLAAAAIAAALVASAEGQGRGPGLRRPFAAAPSSTTAPASRPRQAALPSPTSISPARAAVVYEGPAAGKPQCEIDKLVFGRLEKLGIEPANLCSDAVFIRRAYLDVIGTLPTEQETRDFLASKAPDKRSALIDKLLDREEFASYWAMKWSDLLRVKAEFPVDLWPNAAQAYHRWIRTSIRQNKPYDRFVRELLTASGSNFREPAVNFYRAVQGRTPEAIAQAAALTFMGERADRWPKDRLAGMAAFFSQISYKHTLQWKEEIVALDIAKASTQPAAIGGQGPVYPDGIRAKVPPGGDPREVFADWLIDGKNPWFARNIVNRIWYWLLGLGIIHEPDDIRADNPPSNPELLAYLEKELVAANWDLKHVYKLILNSKTYQLSCIPRSNRPEAALSAKNFASYPLRRLDAEVLIDALCQITGTTEKYSSPIPEPFTYIPEGHRTVDLPDGSITSSFLVMFGRPARDTGLESERNNRPTADQRLYMLNSSHVLDKLERGRKLQPILRGRGGRDMVTQLYLTILSRYPTDEEMAVAEASIQAGGGGGLFKARDGAIDLAWALINSAEFLYRH
ncbi:MAG: DUF1553 domain-containing protein [Phycisphaerae bacterium]